MKTKTLIVSIIGIFGIAAGAYLVISPYATQTLDAPYEPIVATTTATTTVTTAATTSTEAEKPVSTKPANTPAPTPKPTPTPTPTPEPEPVVSGYTSAEVAMHASQSSCWSIVNGEVYDLTAYITKHPGGEKNILRICGKDGSSAFEGQHGGDSKPERILASYRIGSLR